MPHGKLHHLPDLVYGFSKPSYVLVGQGGPPLLLYLHRLWLELHLCLLRYPDYPVRVGGDDSELGLPGYGGEEYLLYVHAKEIIKRPARTPLLHDREGHDYVLLHDRPHDEILLEQVRRHLQEYPLLGWRKHDPPGLLRLGLHHLYVLPHAYPGVPPRYPVHADYVKTHISGVGPHGYGPCLLLPLQLHYVPFLYPELLHGPRVYPDNTASELLPVRELPHLQADLVHHNTHLDFGKSVTRVTLEL